jgi:predicted AAA+ superfamily ATPase
MIERIIIKEFQILLKEFPVVTILGPRQAGKTTLARMALPAYTYVNLENPETRDFALDDPNAFLKQYDDKIIFDEIQRAPKLLSYLQEKVDNRSIGKKNVNGQFILTGSHQLELRAAISQSLAGRTGILHLLPLSIEELDGAGIHFEHAEDYIFNGFLPRVYDQNQRPRTAYANYYQTYIERDVRQLIQLKDASLFEKFIKLLAGRVGQLMNYQSLANDIGVDNKTIRQWLSILEASFVVFKLSPYFENFGKRVIKSPKYYFNDTGLLSYLLDIEKPAQINRDPLVGNIFENLIVLEALKARYNKGQPANLYFFRDSHGHEIDLLYKSGNKFTGIEIKSAQTWHKNFKKELDRFSNKITPLEKAFVIYRGDNRKYSDGVEALGFKHVVDIFSE